MPAGSGEGLWVANANANLAHVATLDEAFEGERVGTQAGGGNVREHLDPLDPQHLDITWAVPGWEGRGIGAGGCQRSGVHPPHATGGAEEADSNAVRNIEDPGEGVLLGGEPCGKR